MNGLKDSDETAIEQVMAELRRQGHATEPHPENEAERMMRAAIRAYGDERERQGRVKALDAESRACGLAEALADWQRWAEDGGCDLDEYEEGSLFRAADAALKSDARCSHAARVEVLEKALKAADSFLGYLDAHTGDRSAWKEQIANKRALFASALSQAQTPATE